MIELTKALVAAQKDMPALKQDGSNPHFHSTFVTLDNMIAATRPVLNKHGLAISQFPAISDLGQPTLLTRLVHVSGESVEHAMPLLLPTQDMQKLGAALTYARRYAWASVCGIAADTDDDGNTASTPPDPVEELDYTTFKWASGKHVGSSLGDTPVSYIEWYAANGPKPEVRAVCDAYVLSLGGPVPAGDFEADDEDIPF